MPLPGSSRHGFVGAMNREHLTPISSLALAATLALGAVLVAPDAHAGLVRAPTREATRSR